MKLPSRIAIGIAALAAVVCLGYWGGRQIFIRAFAQTDLNIRPYIADDIQFYVANGKQIVSATEITARRKDGAFRRAETFYRPDGTTEFTLSRVEFPDGYVAMVSDYIRGKSTGTRSSAQVAGIKNSLLNSPPHCAYSVPGLTETVEGEDTLFGFKAYRVIRPLASEKRYLSWRLPDFNCVVVQSLEQTFDETTNSWQTTAGKRLTAFAEVTPDPQIFTDWSIYSEMKPSDLKRAVYTKSGITAAQCPKCFGSEEESDTNYQLMNAH